MVCACHYSVERASKTYGESWKAVPEAGGFRELICSRYRRDFLVLRAGGGEAPLGSVTETTTHPHSALVPAG